jgi:hypothetical protein
MFIAGLVIGLFGSSQILYPIFYSLPRLTRLKKQGKLNSKYSLAYVFGTPLIWVVLYALLVFAALRFAPTHVNALLMGLGISAAIILFQIPKGNPDLFTDFIRSYGKHINGGYSECRKGKMAGGLISMIMNEFSGHPYIISTAQELGRKYWSSSVIDGNSEVTKNPTSVLAVVRNSQADAHEVHRQLEELVLHQRESDWVSKSPNPMPPDGLSDEAKEVLESKGVRA